MCPLDADNDIDGDGVCGDVDVCPLDVNDDSDGDGSCDSDDACPGSDDNVDTDNDGLADGCDDTPDGDILLTWSSDSESHATLSYESNVNIYGFQLTVNGVDLTDSFDGVLDVYFSENTQNLVAFSMDGESLPAGEGTLITFEFIPETEGAILSLSDISVVRDGAAALGVTGPDALNIIPCENNDGDEICNVADLCMNDADNDIYNDGVCGDVDPCPLDAYDDSDGEGSGDG